MVAGKMKILEFFVLNYKPDIRSKPIGNDLIRMPLCPAASMIDIRN